MKWIKAIEPAKGNHADTLIVRFKGKKRLIENRYGEYWVWQTDREKEIRVYDNQWAELEYLDESTPASITDEAKEQYPDLINDDKNKPYLVTPNEVSKYMREAHVDCAGMYLSRLAEKEGEIEGLSTRVKELEEHLKGIYEMYGDEWTNYAQEWTEKVLRIKQSN